MAYYQSQPRPPSSVYSQGSAPTTPIEYVQSKFSKLHFSDSAGQERPHSPYDHDAYNGESMFGGVPRPNVYLPSQRSTRHPSQEYQFEAPRVAHENTYSNMYQPPPDYYGNHFTQAPGNQQYQQMPRQGNYSCQSNGGYGPSSFKSTFGQHGPSHSVSHPYEYEPGRSRSIHEQPSDCHRPSVSHTHVYRSNSCSKAAEPRQDSCSHVHHYVHHDRPEPRRRSKTRSRTVILAELVDTRRQKDALEAGTIQITDSQGWKYIVENGRSVKTGAENCSWHCKRRRSERKSRSSNRNLGDKVALMAMDTALRITLR